MKVLLEYDPSASVWVASSLDFVGLVAENSSLEKLGRMIDELIPMVVAENGQKTRGR